MGSKKWYWLQNLKISQHSKVKTSAQFVGAGEGVNTLSGASQPPQNVYYPPPPPEKIVKISHKYIADPLWFSHKSSTGQNL